MFRIRIYLMETEAIQKEVICMLKIHFKPWAYMNLYRIDM